MNRTNLEHAIFALAIQAVIWAATGSCIAGGVGGALFFLGREHAQYELHLKHVRHLSSLNQLRPWEGFAFLWRKCDSRWDFLAPVIAVSLVCFAERFIPYGGI